LQNKKLIEVALPLEAINRESAREKEPFTRKHPRGLHIWWARRPLTAARAVLFAQLVDDPSAHPELFPTEAAQRRERERLHSLIGRLVVWENSWDDELFEEARAEILKSSNGALPSILDPFAGGGTIPLEAQRLGLEARASDLNPVAVLINRALIEIPPKQAGGTPVFPGLAESTFRDWHGAEGLVADVRAYGEWLLSEAGAVLAPSYPRVALPGGGLARAIGWIWARTVICPNPACRLDLPLVRSWWLSKKKGKEAYVAASLAGDPQAKSGFSVRFEVQHTKVGGPLAAEDGTVDRLGATCMACSSPVSFAHVRSEGRAGRLGQRLLATVAEGHRTRVYVSPDETQELAAQVATPDDVPEALIPLQALGFRVQAYGMTKWTDLFTARQLLALATLNELVPVARRKVLSDGGSEAYSDAIATYLGLAISRYADLCNTICSWNQTNENVRALFSRQAIPMTWDFVEANPLGPIGPAGPIESVCNSIYVGLGVQGGASQASATAVDFSGAVISTDPPYYDNIGYSDLSDFFYVWLRKSLRDVHPDLLSTVLVPKADELVANPYRHDGKGGAKAFFEQGFMQVFARARATASRDYPITVYYAFKQSESDYGGEASTGWETLLEGMIQNGWEITSTWPIRSERAARAVGLGANALASSIVLSLRPRPAGGATTDRRGFIADLEAELPEALRRLQQGQIAPVDLPQAAIGPGMAVFSRYAAVLEPDGSRMPVRAALARINEMLDQVLNEQEGEFDAASRFGIAWYRQHGYQVGPFGDADNLARARNTSVDAMDRQGILTARAGSVQLIKPSELAPDYDVIADAHTSNWESLHHLMRILEGDGVAPAGDFLRAALSRVDGAVDADLVKELAHLLFRLAEGAGRTQDALSFNGLVTSWPEIFDATTEPSRRDPKQSSFDFEDEA
jgi:putative DNA methylase